MDFQRASRRNWQSPTQSLTSPIKSEGGNTKYILAQLFSQEFLGCLKNELGSKLKETKSIQSLYKQALLQLKICKKQLQKVRNRNEDLLMAKKRMAEQLMQTESAQLRVTQQPKIVIIPPARPKLQIVRSVNVVIQGGDEIIRLRERLQRLQISKSIKQQRVNQLMQQTVRVDTALKVLLHKNDELQEEVKSLRLTVMVQGEQKALTKTLNSEKDPQIAMSIRFTSGSLLKKPSNLHQPQGANKNSSDLSLIASFTNNIKIPQSLELSRACLKRPPIANNNKDFLQINEIDDIISQELPYLNLTGEFTPDPSQLPKEEPTYGNLNESIVLINLNS